MPLCAQACIGSVVSKQSEVLAIIPAHNEGASLLNVVNAVRSVRPAVDYIVINDGSSDNTSEICHDAGVNVIDLPVNLGLSGAFQAGMKYARRHGYRFAVQIDGDGQHDPSYINAMYEQACKGADIVLGSRYLDKRRPFSLRMLGSCLISGATRLISGVHISDPTSGMRMFSKPLIADFALRSYFTPEPDTIAHLIRRGAKVAEVAIPDIQREHGSSYLTFSQSVSYMFRVIISTFIFSRRESKVDTAIAGYAGFSQADEEGTARA